MKTKEQLERLRKLSAEADPMGVLWIDDNGDPHLDANKAAAVFGLSLEEIELVYRRMMAEQFPEITLVKVDHRERGS